MFRTALEAMAEAKSLDVVMATHHDNELRLRIVGRPETHLAILLEKLGLPLANEPKSICNVVEKFQ